MTIWNLTQHDATPDQIEAGVADLPSGTKQQIRALLTFDSLPTQEEIEDRAFGIWAAVAALRIIQDDDKIMIGGAPFLMPALQQRLLWNWQTPVYAFSKRESVDVPQSDGSVRKTAIFKHAGFVECQ